MKNASQARWTDLVLAVVVTLLVPVAFYIGWPWLSKYWAPAPQGDLLIYEVDPDSVPKSMSIDMRQLVRTIERRFGSLERLPAEVRLLDENRIEVAMIRKDNAERRDVENLLDQTSTVDFCILANKKRDQRLIVEAMLDPTAMRVLDENGNRLAYWVPVKPERVAELKDYDDVVLRTTKHDGRDRTEVLIVQDTFHVNGAYLLGVKAGLDRRGRPEICFMFTEKGGKLFREMTTRHLPKKSENLFYKLGIVINGELYAAPIIVSTVYSQAHIAGSGTMAEVRELADRLDSGCLPARLRRFEEPKPEPPSDSPADGKD